MQRLFTRWQWQISVTNFVLEDGHRKFLNRHRLTPPKDREWADPFIVTDKGTNYIFLEEKEFQQQNAHIAVVTVDSCGTVIDKKPVTVLNEQVHLSYPFVFKYQNEYYLLPESGDSGSLRLYKAENFPVSWRKEKVLIKDEMIYDPTLYKHEDGNWYLFCTAKPQKKYSSNAYLHIYYSSDLLNGEFKPHPVNPVYSDVRCSRPAGTITKSAGKLIRPFQVCAPAYGNGIGFAEIEHLSKTCYKEKIVDCIDDYKDIDFAKTHTFNLSGNLAVTDLLVRRNRF